MSIAQPRSGPSDDPSLSDLITLRRAKTRRARLESLFDDAEFVTGLMREGRYLRLCAAVALACEREARAQAAHDAGAMAAKLRAARAGAKY